MSRRSKLLATAAALLAALSAPGRPARAACNVSATPVAFGRYDVFSALPLDSTGTVTVWCDEVPPPDVTVAIGPSATGGGFNPRKLRHAGGSAVLQYNLFTSAAMSTVWGDGTSGTSTVLIRGVRRNSPPVVTTIFGRVPPRQDVPAGNYSDTLTVTITW